MTEIQHHATWLAYHADVLRAAIGARDPNEIEGVTDCLDRAERDIAEIRYRAARHQEAAE